MWNPVIISALIVMLLIMVLEMVSMNPFNQAWVVLKMTMEESRQTELGEYHPDFPSSYGPVDYYHGTTVEPASRINTEGLKPAVPWYGVNGTNPKGIYGADDLEEASDYASMRGQDRNQGGRVFGIRGGVPETPTIMGDDGILRVVRFNEPIPRQYITPVNPVHWSDTLEESE